MVQQTLVTQGLNRTQRLRHFCYKAYIVLTAADMICSFWLARPGGGGGEGVGERGARVTYRTCHNRARKRGSRVDGAYGTRSLWHTYLRHTTYGAQKL